MNLRKDGESKSYCGCVEEIEKKLNCSCGEMANVEPVWKLDENAKTPTTIISENGRKAHFHLGYSIGNDCVRGDTQLLPGYDHYWEIKIMSSVYGTSMMIGIGTEDFNINQSNERFCDLLGCDGESWGLKFDGSLHHDKEINSYNPIAGFAMGSIVGVHLNMWNGTLEYYLNRIPLGIAFRGLKNKILYPLLSSTASYTAMKLIFAHSEPHSLSLLSVKHLRENLFGYLPPGLKSYSKTCWWLFPKSSRLKHDKKFDILSSLHTFDILTDSDEEDNSDSSEFNILAHKVKRVFQASSIHNSFRYEGGLEIKNPIPWRQ